MVIGNGLVATAFRAFSADDRVIIFASGVSRSTEQNAQHYQREVDLLNEYRNSSGRLIYFSTVSLFDPSLVSSAYIRHKRSIEEHIRDSFPDHLIVRLPNLVGRTSNPNTLTNFLRDRIVGEEPFELHRNACRYLMDVDDMVQDLSPLLTRGDLAGSTMNACGSDAIALPVLVATMERVLGRKAAIRPVDKGSCYAMDNTIFLALLSPERRQAYSLARVEEILRKYYGS